MSTGGVKPSIRAGVALLRTRWFVRAPILLYRARLGAVFGRRLLMLEHVGRVSGRTQHAVLEIVDHPAPDRHIVVSGFGERAQWFRNITARPHVRVYLGSRKPAPAVASRLEPDAAASAINHYATAHRRAWAKLRLVLEQTLNRKVDESGTGLTMVAIDLAAHSRTRARLPVRKTTTHFLHDESAHANDVSFLAHAFFKAIVPPEYVDCYALAGVSIPTDKDLKDMTVIWSLPNGRVGLKPAVVGGRQFDVPIDLNGDGESIVQTTPRRDSHPPVSGEKRPQSTFIQQVRVAMDKNYLEAHLSDIILMLFGTVAEAALSIAFKVVVALLQEAGLPERTVDFPVTYHGSDTYHIFGDANLTVPFFAEVPLKADLYSCQSPEGPWQGTITIAGSAGAALQAVGAIAGIDASGSGQEVAQGRFTLNTNTSQLQTFPFTDKYGLVVELDQSAIDSGFQKESGTNVASERMRRIGWASWTIGGQDVRVLAGLIGGFMSQSLDIPVEAVPGDLRCSGTAVY